MNHGGIAVGQKSWKSGRGRVWGLRFSQTLPCFGLAAAARSISLQMPFLSSCHLYCFQIAAQTNIRVLEFHLWEGMQIFGSQKGGIMIVGQPERWKKYGHTVGTVCVIRVTSISEWERHLEIKELGKIKGRRLKTQSFPALQLLWCQQLPSCFSKPFTKCINTNLWNKPMVCDM